VKEIENYQNGYYTPARPDEDLTTLMTYDAVGNLVQVANPRYQVTSFQYDELNRPVTVADALSGTVAYDYDGVGNLIAVTDAEGHTTAYAYDDLNARRYRDCNTRARRETDVDDQCRCQETGYASQDQR
jgi:YD repeat-containing protein